MRRQVDGGPHNADRGIDPQLGARRFAVICNPLAGSGPARRRLAGVLDRLRADGSELVVRQGEGPAGNQSLALAALADGNFDAVIVAGGDGTIRATAPALVGTPMPLGIIPVGTGNVLAHEIGLKLEPEEIAKCLLYGHTVSISTARANGELFLLMAGAGFDGRVIGALDLAFKQRVGKLAYVWPVARALLAAPDRLIVNIDGVEHRAAWAVVTLRARYAGAFVISHHAYLGGSGFRVVLFRPGSRVGLARQLLALASGAAGPYPAIDDLPGRHVEITTDRPVPAQIDGEAAGTTPLRIESGGPMLRLIAPTSAH